MIKKVGGDHATAFGLAGIGDMSLTCSGPHSRNMAYGIDIIKNNYHRPTRLVEGLNALDAAISLSKDLNVELPIVEAIYKIINKKADIKDIIKKLLARPIKNEFS